MDRERLPCRSVFKGGNNEMRYDRWVTWKVEVRCSNHECERDEDIELAYPCLRMPTSWSHDGGGPGEHEDTMKRVILQPTTRYERAKKEGNREG